MTTFTQYRRTNIAEMRNYVPGEDLSNVSVSAVDTPENDLGMIARNPNNHADQWYVAKQYFDDNFEEASAPPKIWVLTGTTESCDDIGPYAWMVEPTEEQINGVFMRDIPEEVEAECIAGYDVCPTSLED